MPSRKIPKNIECFKPPYRRPEHKPYKINPYMPVIPTPAPTYVPLQNDYERCRPYEGWIEAPKYGRLPEARWMHPYDFLKEEVYRRMELNQRRFYKDVDELKNAIPATVAVIDRCPKKMKINHPPPVLHDYRFVGWSCQPDPGNKDKSYRFRLKDYPVFSEGYRYPEPNDKAFLYRVPNLIYKNNLPGPPWV